MYNIVICFSRRKPHERGVAGPFNDDLAVIALGVCILM